MPATHTVFVPLQTLVLCDFVEHIFDLVVGSIRSFLARVVRPRHRVIAKTGSVCLSVCLSHSWVTPKRLKVPKYFFNFKPAVTPVVLSFNQQAGFADPLTIRGWVIDDLNFPCPLYQKPHTYASSSEGREPNFTKFGEHIGRPVNRKACADSCSCAISVVVICGFVKHRQARCLTNFFCVSYILLTSFWSECG